MCICWVGNTSLCLVSRICLCFVISTYKSKSEGMCDNLLCWYIQVDIICCVGTYKSMFSCKNMSVFCERICWYMSVSVWLVRMCLCLFEVYTSLDAWLVQTCECLDGEYMCLCL